MTIINCSAIRHNCNFWVWSLVTSGKVFLYGFDNCLIFCCDDWPHMAKLFLIGFDHWLIFDWLRRLIANGKIVPFWFWSLLADLWLWWLTASGKMSVLGIPWMKQHSFGKNGVQESQTSMSNEYVPVSNASNCVCSIEWCACRYVLFMLRWANLAIGGVESFWCTVLDHFNLNFKTQQSHCQRVKPGFFFYFFLCISQKLLLTHPHGDLVILTIPVNRTQSFPVGAQITITVS